MTRSEHFDPYELLSGGKIERNVMCHPHHAALEIPPKSRIYKASASLSKLSCISGTSL